METDGTSLGNDGGVVAGSCSEVEAPPPPLCHPLACVPMAAALDHGLLLVVRRLQPQSAPNCFHNVVTSSNHVTTLRERTFTGGTRVLGLAAIVTSLIPWCASDLVLSSLSFGYAALAGAPLSSTCVGTYH
jgi:hypothetical protein